MVATNSRIAVPGGVRPIGEIAVGDEVLAGSASDGKWVWAPAQVAHSAGTLGGIPHPMVFLRYGNEFEALAAEADLPLLLSDGRLARADKLVPGDELVAENGDPLTIHMVSIGNHIGGEHAVALAFDHDTPSDKLDGHLLLVNGVVIGDFYLQMRWQGE